MLTRCKCSSSRCKSSNNKCNSNNNTAIKITYNSLINSILILSIECSRLDNNPTLCMASLATLRETSNNSISRCRPLAEVTIITSTVLLKPKKATLLRCLTWQLEVSKTSSFYYSNTRFSKTKTTTWCLTNLNSRTTLGSRLLKLKTFLSK